MTDKDIKVEEANKLLEEKGKEYRDKKFQEDKEAYDQEKDRELSLKYKHWLNEVRNSGNIKGAKEGSPQTYAEELKLMADDVINARQTSVNDWRSNMMDLLHLFAKLNKVVNISSNQVAAEGLNRLKKETQDIPIVRAITHPDRFMYQKVKSAILHSIKDPGKFEVESFKKKVTFEDGKVKVAPLTYADDGIPLKEEDKANKAFNKLVEIWLLENKYAPSPQKDGSYVHLEDDSVLDLDTFNRLNDPLAKTNLAKFLDANAKFKFEEQVENEQQSGLTPS